MGETSGSWGEEALRKLRTALNHAEATLETLSAHPAMSKRVVVEGAQLRSALRGELGEAEKRNAERFDWCAKVSQQTPHTVERVEYLLNCFDENREALLAFLGVDKLSGTSG